MEVVFVGRSGLRRSNCMVTRGSVINKSSCHGSHQRSSRDLLVASRAVSGHPGSRVKIALFAIDNILS